MTKSIKILIATTALSAVLGLPAWSAMTSSDQETANTATEVRPANEPGSKTFIFASGDNGDDRDHENERDDDDRDDDDDDDDDHRRSSDDDDNTRNALPTGSVTPPQNGLFESGAKPQVKIK